MLDPSLRNDLIELLAANFRTAEINEIGKLLFREYDTHRLSGTQSHISVAPRKSAGLLVEHCQEKDELGALIHLVVELDGGTMLGRAVRLEGLESFLHRLASYGYVYDFHRQQLLGGCPDQQELVNWGSLKDGREYPITILSLDIVDNSGLLRRYGTRRMEQLYFRLHTFLRTKLRVYDGRVWTWAGDGGVLAFAFGGQADRVVYYALEIQRTVSLFSIGCDNPLPEPVRLRMAADSGRIRFYSDTGRIVSEVINYACHLEKQCTAPGMVSVSAEVHKALNPGFGKLFRPAGSFEERDYYCTSPGLDTLQLEPARKASHRARAPAG